MTTSLRTDDCRTSKISRTIATRSRRAFPSSIPLVRRVLLSVLFCAGLGMVPAGAQDATQTSPDDGQEGESQEFQIYSGDVIVSRFSGFAAEGAIDQDGPTVQLVDVSAPGKAPDGAIWVDPTGGTLSSAGEIGQVFGLATMADETVTVFAAATSAFGLHVDTEGNWLDGQWGEGGPGGIYRFSADNGYVPELFATITLDGRENTGAALGNIAYDPAHKQLFVSDLESGMIYRLSAETGDILGRFDHGVDGRSYFLDAELADYAVLDVVPFEPETKARIGDCTDAGGGKAAFGKTPSCWNVADFRRRVWGLGVRVDPDSGATRLYYAVWGGAALGQPEWADAGEDAHNSVWSIALTAEGDFDIQDIRREVVLPDFIPNTSGNDAARQPNPAISDIAFTDDGVMLLAERGGLALPGTVPTFADPHAGRVLRLYRGEDGLWNLEARYNVGNAERREVPFIRANAAGGIATGFGYGDDHQLDTAKTGAFLWVSGNALCGPEGPCFQDDTTIVNGVQGMPLDSGTEVLPDSALKAPGNGISATPPDGVDSAYMIALSDGLSDASVPPTYAGDVEVAGLPVDEAGEETQAGDGEDAADTAAAPEGTPVEPEVEEGDAGPRFDLAVRKSGPATCEAGGSCTFNVGIVNTGPDDYDGPIFLYDDMSVGGATVDTDIPGWICSQNDTGVYCSSDEGPLAAGSSLALTLTYQLPDALPARSILNCAELAWLGRSYETRMRFLQEGLAVRGYDPGAIDGLYGPNTAAAVGRARADFGLGEGEAVDSALIEALFGPGADAVGDENPLNDRSCARVAVPGPAVTDHWVALSAFHRKFASSRHDSEVTAFVDQHEPALSRFHRQYRSARHDGATTSPLAIHSARLSSFHMQYRSARHDGVFTRYVPSHNPALSVFHRSVSSFLHDPVTTQRLSTHYRPLSRFHQRWRSGRHDQRVTNLAPVHVRRLSQFHLRNRSARHDGTFSNAVPVHAAALSAFHRSVRSGLHDRRLTRMAPGSHSVGVSAVHRRVRSTQHDPWTTRVRSAHASALSNFHQQRRSATHNPRTTSAAAAHDAGISRLHRQVRSVMHDARTTGRRQDVHAAAISAFHVRVPSRQHNARTSRSAASLDRDHRDPNRPKPDRSEIERRKSQDDARKARERQQQQREQKARQERQRRQQADEARKRRQDAERQRRQREQKQRQDQQRQKQRQEQLQRQRQQKAQEERRQKQQQQLQQQRRQEQQRQPQQELRQKQRQDQLQRQRQQKAQEERRQKQRQEQLQRQRQQKAQEERRQKQRQQQLQQQRRQEQQRQQRQRQQQQRQRQQQSQNQQRQKARQLQRFHNRAPSSQHDTRSSRRK